MTTIGPIVSKIIYIIKSTHTDDRQIDDRQIDKQTDRQIDRQIGDSQTDKKRQTNEKGKPIFSYSRSP